MFGQSPEVFVNFEYKKKSRSSSRVITWKSKIMSVKGKIGEFIGYGTSFLCRKKDESGSIPIGYSMAIAVSLAIRKGSYQWTTVYCGWLCKHEYDDC
jgi:alanine racemase